MSPSDSEPGGSMPVPTPHKRIATEEGYNIPEVLDARDRYLEFATDEPGMAGHRGVVPGGPGLLDWSLRVADMDRDGIDTQILLLSSPGVQIFDKSEATALARLSNDRATEEAVKRYPGRFALLATMAPQDPAAAAAELERAVTTLGAKGGLINSHTKGEYLDDQKFWPILEAAESLDAPIYIHPREPAPAMLAPYQRWGLTQATWGYAAEVSLHCLRMIMSGVFDRFPRLTIVIGHAGENIPFALDRIDTRVKKSPRPGQIKLDRLPSEYFIDNFVVTTSGINWEPTVQFLQRVLGTERVMFAVDYPFEDQAEAVKAAEDIEMGDQDQLMFFQSNAERVFKLA